jgi:methionyl-tRNA synthetase
MVNKTSPNVPVAAVVAKEEANRPQKRAAATPAARTTTAATVARIKPNGEEDVVLGAPKRMTRPTVITAALPYANGKLHIGHLVEYVQADIAVRARRQLGDQVHFHCAADSHGTPIQMNAKKRGISPEALVDEARQGFIEDFATFNVEFDIFHTTHSEENQQIASQIYESLKERGEILREDREQLFCETDNCFLPDRFIKGICPKCSAKEQYGDGCEQCGATYNTTELVDPACAICGGPPVTRSSESLLFNLPLYTEALQKWTQGALRTSVKNWVDGWFKSGLKPWDISREGPYFGFPIPGEENKFFYVWLDAPVGYIATARRWASDQGWDDPDFLWRGDNAERIHVIGKDIVYFHSLFWPAMLMGSGWGLPDKIQVHGMLQVNGAKMSKSRGTFIGARSWADHLPPEYLRFYYARRLNDGIEDLSLDFDDFVGAINGELVGKFVNLCSRTIGFVGKRFAGELAERDEVAGDMVEKLRARSAEAMQLFADFKHAQAMRLLIQSADEANTYLQDRAPWALFKENPAEAQKVCASAIDAAQAIFAGLQPVLPQLCAELSAMLGLDLSAEKSWDIDLGATKINAFARLADRVERSRLDELVEACKPLA